MNARGQYGTSRVGEDSQESSSQRTVREIAHIIEPRSVFYDPRAFDVEKLPGEMPSWGPAVLLGTLGVIIGIGVIGTKMKVRWF